MRSFPPSERYDPHERKHLWAPTDEKLGEKFEFDLKRSKLLPEKKLEIQRRCHDFLIEAINQIDKRIDNTTMKMKYIKHLSPKNCLSQMKPRFTNEDLPFVQLAKDENFDILKVANQWEQLSMKTNWREEFPNSDIPTDPVEFWAKVHEYKNACGENCYRELATIALNSYCIPLSTAFVERVFSHVTNVKTKARNRLSTSSLEAILRIRSHMSHVKTKARNRLSTSSLEAILRIRSHMFVHDICCQKFKVTDKMIRLFTNAIYKTDSSSHTGTEINPQPSTSSAQASPAFVPTLSEENEVCSFDEILSIVF
ncbi:hypothetical protein Pmani_006575 [Petrolisthes manimaculis]|uniref:HAT C-terminal dimerisation domain-containing protein n=1 Tax=Petrolisthes manimaculis TaxID=1843537 RepID=A0AAE1Q9I2_9EUCA|nr:hypothetical protein Pmani_006575 [Petrolisthes manimaculis]